MSTPDHDELAAEFPEVVDILQNGLPATPTEAPGEHVWAAIAAELGQPVTVAAPGPEEAPDSGAEDGSSPDADGELGATVLPLHRRPPVWGRPVVILTAAAAILLVAIPLVLAFRGDGVAVRRADLAALGGWAGEGRAELEGHDLTVSLDGGAAPEGSYYELWLLDMEGQELRDLRSLGPVEIADDDSFVIPDDVDLDRFDVVDVSIEPDDGNPEHSGKSVLRGGLAEAGA